jgi:hypothetical protein
VLIALAFEILAFSIELDDPNAIGDEPSSLFFLLLMLANRFV